MKKTRRTLVRLFCAAVTLAALLSGCASDSGQAGASTPPASTPPTATPAPSETPSLLTLDGVFYRNTPDEDGLIDCIVVFDYTNDAQNRELPEDPSEITLDFNGVNTYDIHQVTGTVYAKGKLEYPNHYYYALSRYTGYSYALGYGTLLGGADPVRMFAVFYVNPNDLSGDGEMVFTMGDQSLTIPVSQAKEITLLDEIMTVEEDYQMAQATASLKWRFDKAYSSTQFVSRNLKIPGDDFNAMATGMEYIFKEGQDWGYSVAEIPSGGFSGEDTGCGMYNDAAATAGLPGLDLALMAETYPEIADDITGMAETTNALAQAIRTPGTSLDSIIALMDTMDVHFANFQAYFDMEALFE